MKIKKQLLLYALIFSLVMLSHPAYAASNATIYGYVVDRDTGRPFEEILVEIFSAKDPSTPVAVAYTDLKGYYNTTILAGDTYNIYVRIGKTHPQQTVYVGEGSIQQVDFTLSLKSTSRTDELGDNSFLIVAIVAIIILAIVLADQFYLRKKKLRELEAEKQSLETKLANEGEPTDELSVMKKEKSRIEYMINMTKTKYHKRNIDEESFREIMRDYQKTLIEIESKIRELEGG